METLHAQPILEAQAQLAEGPTWDDAHQRLTWVDVPAGKVHRFDPASGEDESWEIGVETGFAARTLVGDYILGTRAGLLRFEPGSGQTTPLVDPEPELGSRFNDGKCDVAGRLWAGTISDERKPICGLYRYDLDGNLQLMIEGVVNSNGLVWSPEGDTFYYIDTGARRIDAFDFEPVAGTLANRRTVVEAPEELGIGKPDGMTIDVEGMLWTGMFGGGRVCRWNPHTGERLADVLVPAEQSTSCCFGGPGLRQLFITTGRHNLSEEQLAKTPLAGSIFVCEPGVAGLPMAAYRG